MQLFICLSIPRPPRPTLPDPLFPYTTLFRSLDDIYAALGGTPPAEDRALWTAALEGTDPLAMEALERFCLSLGSVAGDLLRAVAGRDRKSTRLNSSH